MKTLSKYNLDFDKVEYLTFYKLNKNKYYLTATINNEECFIEDSVAYSEDGFESVIKMFENKFKNKSGFLQIDPYIINVANVKHALPCIDTKANSPRKKYYLMIVFNDGTHLKTKSTANKELIYNLAKAKFKAYDNNLAK